MIIGDYDLDALSLMRRVFDPFCWRSSLMNRFKPSMKNAAEQGLSLWKEKRRAPEIV